MNIMEKARAFYAEFGRSTTYTGYVGSLNQSQHMMLGAGVTLILSQLLPVWVAVAIFAAGYILLELTQDMPRTVETVEDSIIDAAFSIGGAVLFAIIGVWVIPASAIFGWAFGVTTQPIKVRETIPAGTVD